MSDWSLTLSGRTTEEGTEAVIRDLVIEFARSLEVEYGAGTIQGGTFAGSEGQRNLHAAVNSTDDDAEKAAEREGSDAVEVPAPTNPNDPSQPIPTTATPEANFPAATPEANFPGETTNPNAASS